VRRGADGAVIPAAFDYVRAASPEDAVAALADPDAKAIAGGHSLLPLMKLRLARPSLLVDIAGLDLRGVTAEDGAVRIGALTTYDELLRGGTPLPDALREAASSVGDLQVRNAGTLGGAVAHGDPAADVAAPLLALGATFRLRGPDGVREVAAERFFLGPFVTALEQQELLVELVVPEARGSAYVSFDDPASGYPLVGAAAAVRPGGTVVALTGVGGHPFVEDGRELDLSEYRRHLARVAVRRAVEAAEARAG
jgi:carbon-monoxide dehydrogenase medium subunit